MKQSERTCDGVGDGGGVGTVAYHGREGSMAKCLEQRDCCEMKV